MPAIDFPNSPTVGQEFNSGITVFVWTGSFWRVKYSGSPGDTLSDTTPLMNGSASAGVAVTASRADHVHPSDTSRAPLDSPALTGTPTAPTAAANTNTTQIATTAYVIGQGYAKLSDLGSTYQAYDADLTDIANINTGSGFLYRTNGVGYSLDSTVYAPLSSPTFTGIPAAPTASVDTNTTQIATTAFVVGQSYVKSSTFSSTLSSYAPLASPALTGTPTAPTAPVDTSGTQIATTGFVMNQAYLKAATASASYQPLDADLTSIAALAGTSGFLYKTAADTYTLDTNTYINTSASTQTINGSLTVGTNLTVDGDLTVNGTQNILDTTNLSITDSLIYLADNQFNSDILDIGIFGAYGDVNPGHFHTGLIRDATDKIWKLVSGAPEPVSNEINFSASALVYDTLKIGALEVSSSAIVNNFNAQYLNGVQSSAFALLSGATFTGGVTFSANAPAINITGAPSATSSTNGLLNVGTLSWSDTDIVAGFAHSVNSYAQLVIQNKNSGSLASADVIVSNNTGSATSNYGDFGINSSGYTGSSPWNDPSGTYLYANGGSLTVGTQGTNALRLVTNNIISASVDGSGIFYSGTAAVDTNTNQVATTAYVIGQGYLKSSSYTASDVLTKLLTVDGAASNLDSDLLDGQQGAYYTEEVITFTRTATAAVSTGQARFRFPFAATIQGISAAIATAPTGANLILDINKNGSTIFTTQANRPTITADTNEDAEVTNMDITNFAIGDYLTVDIDQVGSTIAGSDLTVMIRYRRA